MATHHRGAGEPLDRDSAPHEQGTDALSKYNHEDMDNFENVEHEKPHHPEGPDQKPR